MHVVYQKLHQYVIFHPGNVVSIDTENTGTIKLICFYLSDSKGDNSLTSDQLALAALICLGKGDFILKFHFEYAEKYILLSVYLNHTIMNFTLYNLLTKQPK